ncbi:hypothetical protein B0J11DRAFT_112070 [Dendryphion nanum]|uniref:BTB domain-containing protein n=1 Tax=Dendryphion nanum TaxID=256645 RepID=A0A9P9DAZ5_9PLEO|nr:hypothetical protein B0J11DRAFT_112070 [Dendryphion nanum]
MNQPEDVEVILSHDQRYMFHSSVLVRSSSFFAKLLTVGTAVKLSHKAKNAGIKIKWRVILSRLPNSTNPGVLELLELDNSGKPCGRYQPIVMNQNGRVPTRTLDHYQSILYTFYNEDLVIKDDDIHSALADACSILGIAEYLGCTSSISKAIDVALVKHGQQLFRSIQSAPCAWARLGHRIKSELIFKEAIVHLAGDWRNFQGNREVLRNLKNISPEIEAICEKHHHHLITKGKKLELELASLYPGGMAKPSLDLPIKREEYSRDILVWIALTFFRHWLAQRIISEKGYAGRDSGYELYTQIRAGGDAYMDKTVMNQFHGRFPMTKKAMNVVENHLLEIKECMKGCVIAHGILDSNCQLDTHRFPVNYLTCTKVDKEDLPWFVSEDSASGEKRARPLGGNEIVERNLAAADALRALEEEDWDEEGEDEEDPLAEGGASGKRPRLT